MTTLAFFWPCSNLIFFPKACVLGLPKQLLNRMFLDEAISRFDYEDVVKSWMENPTLFTSQPGNI